MLSKFAIDNSQVSKMNKSTKQSLSLLKSEQECENYKYFVKVGYRFIHRLYRLTYTDFDMRLLHICMMLECYSIKLMYNMKNEVGKNSELDFDYLISTVLRCKSGYKKLRLLNGILEQLIQNTLEYAGFNIIINNYPQIKNTFNFPPPDMDYNIIMSDGCYRTILTQEYTDAVSVYDTIDTLNFGKIDGCIKLHYDCYAVKYMDNKDAIKCYRTINNMNIEDNIIKLVYMSARKDDCNIIEQCNMSFNEKIITINTKYPNNETFISSNRVYLPGYPRHYKVLFGSRLIDDARYESSTENNSSEEYDISDDNEEDIESDDNEEDIESDGEEVDVSDDNEEDIENDDNEVDIESDDNEEDIENDDNEVDIVSDEEDAESDEEDDEEDAEIDEEDTESDEEVDDESYKQKLINKGVNFAIDKYYDVKSKVQNYLQTTNQNIVKVAYIVSLTALCTVITPILGKK
jgi:hypothetical protein